MWWHTAAVLDTQDADVEDFKVHITLENLANHYLKLKIKITNDWESSSVGLHLASVGEAIEVVNCTKQNKTKQTYWLGKVNFPKSWVLLAINLYIISKVALICHFKKFSF